MVTKANLLERRNRYDKYGAGVPDGRVTDEYPTPLLFKEAQTPLNENPPQVTSPGSVASGVSKDGQKEIVPPAVVTTDNPHAGMDNKDGGDMPERDNYHFYADLVDQYTKKPMTPEEEERRKRSATAVEGIGHFGNVLNAFSNLVFTGQGAPSQELSKVPAGELQKFEDRVAENRRRYIGARMDADARDKSDWMNAWKMEYQRQRMADDAKRYQDQIDRDSRDFEYRKGIDERNFNYRKEQDEMSMKLQKDRMAEHIRHNMEIEKNYKIASSSSNDYSSKSSGKDYGKKRLEGPNGFTRYYDMNKDSDVIEFYKTAKKFGIFHDTPNSISQMREKIMIATGDWKVDKTGKIIDSSKLGHGEDGSQQSTNSRHLPGVEVKGNKHLNL